MAYMITKNSPREFTITTPGEHIFYFENISGELVFDVQSDNAHVQIFGLYDGKDAENFSLHLTQKHTAPYSKSISLIKSVLRDTSCLHITGNIHVTRSAQHIEAYFTNKNLLLSDHAHITTIPQLEILQHDVRCTHAAQTMPLDSEQLHYMTARGISINDAKELLINGFIDDVSRYKR